MAFGDSDRTSITAPSSPGRFNSPRIMNQHLPIHLYLSHSSKQTLPLKCISWPIHANMLRIALLVLLVHITFVAALDEVSGVSPTNVATTSSTTITIYSINTGEWPPPCCSCPLFHSFFCRLPAGVLLTKGTHRKKRLPACHVDWFDSSHLPIFCRCQQFTRGHR